MAEPRTHHASLRIDGSTIWNASFSDTGNVLQLFKTEEIKSSSSCSATWIKPLKLLLYFIEVNHGNKDDLNTTYDQYILLESNHVETATAKRHQNKLH